MSREHDPETETFQAAAEALVAARKAWEAMVEEVGTHDLSDVYLCLACVKRAEELVEAMRILGQFGRLEKVR